MNPLLRLASASPRRADLLRVAGFRLEITPARLRENRGPDESPDDYVARLSLEKALNVWNRYRELPVLGADTVVVLDGGILEKPRDADEAERMLTALSGATHSVRTGFSLVTETDRVTEVVETRVEFRRLSQEEIREYIRGGDPMDKAGAYGIQSGAAHFVRRIEGSYTNVVGLPMAEVVEAFASIRPECLFLSPREPRRPA